MCHKCLFCPENRFSLNKEIGLLGEEAIIYEDDNVFIIPDIAPLVIGHFLIVSKTHINSFGNANDDIYKSLESAKSYLSNNVFKGTKFMFLEHGAVIESTGGSSIDHAHLHGLPINKDIHIDDYIRTCDFITSRKVACCRKILMSYYKSGQPYIYYELHDRQGWVYPVETLPHQFFRMLIAESLDKEFNWKLEYKNKESKDAFNKTLIYAKRYNSTELG